MWMLSSREEKTTGNMCLKCIVRWLSEGKKRLLAVVQYSPERHTQVYISPRDDSVIILFLEVIGIKLRVCNLALVIFQPLLI